MAIPCLTCIRSLNSCVNNMGTANIIRTQVKKEYFSSFKKKKKRDGREKFDGQTNRIDFGWRFFYCIIKRHGRTKGQDMADIFLYFSHTFLGLFFSYWTLPSLFIYILCIRAIYSPALSCFFITVFVKYLATCGVREKVIRPV